MATMWHELICAELIGIIRPWAREHDLLIVSSAYKVRISEFEGAMPDVQLLPKALKTIANEKALEEGHPELVIEVVSPGSKKHDRFRKLDWYAKIGVPEYWIIEPETKTLTAHRLQGDVYAIIQHAEGDAVFVSRNYTGLEVPLAELWQHLLPDGA